MQNFLNALNINLERNMAAFEHISVNLGDCPYATISRSIDLLELYAQKLRKHVKTNTGISWHISEIQKNIDMCLDKQSNTSDSSGISDINGVNGSECVSVLPSKVVFLNTFKKGLTEKISQYRDQNIAKIKKITAIEGVDLQNNVLKLPIIDNLKNIPPMFYWYNGCRIYKQGIYICICPGFCVKVPFPNLLYGPERESKSNSVKCKYIDKRTCAANKKKISEIYNSEIKQCSYVHTKERFNKIGNIYRCSLERFGNHDSLDDDLKYISNFDIKHLLMYSVSDDLLAAIWYQNKFKNGDLVLSNLDIFE